MAAVTRTADMTIQKNSQILVHVEEALADLIVVSYCTDDKKYQGVLLDSNKSNLPFGVYNLHPALCKQAPPPDTNDDKLHSASQRFLYENPDYESKLAQKKKLGPKSKPQPRQKMTVRLRPRKVLCSNCQGICNENNENVDVSKKRKLDSDDDTTLEADSSRDQKKKYLVGGMLIPKLSRLQPSEISSSIRGVSKNNKASEKSINSDYESDKVTPELTFVSVPEEDNDVHSTKNDESSFNTMFSSARTLKICFGEGEGTVVKIPPLTGDFNEDSGVSCDMNKPESKAAKRAIRKAKKQAKKNSAVSKNVIQSPKHVGALSPRNISDSPALDPLEKRHKHKVKHKKKYKSAKKRDENSSKIVDEQNYFSDIKDHCMNQKLSISLHRLSTFEQPENEVIEGESSDEGETVPEFPDSSEGVGGNLVPVIPGDIVWGKVVGFPWWPGRVLSVTSARAHVAWFASKTSSLIPCNNLSPFLDDFKIRFNKKKRGPYKEAVKQATMEAQQNESQIDPLSPSVLESPRPVDVF